MSRPLDRLLATIAKALGDERIVFAVIGGCARNAYAPPRATRDVDLSVSADEVGWQTILATLGAQGFRCAHAASADPDQSVPDVALFRDSAGDRIDLLIAKTAFERSALARRNSDLRVGRRRLPVVTPEDLIVFKLIASRPRDLADAEEVARTLAESGTKLDWRYVRRWCREWQVLDRLSALRGELRRSTRSRKASAGRPSRLRIGAPASPRR